MTSIKLLVVEDDPQDIGTCQRTAERYRREKQRQVTIVESKNLDESLENVDDTFDGAIIDLRLGDDDEEGNRVIRRIREGQYRFPIAILTGTPSAADRDFSFIGVFKKGEFGAGYEDLFDRFARIQETGLTRILGGRGIVEERLTDVFWKNILPQIDKWETYGEADSARTESALLRHTLNHLIQLIDQDIEEYFPEEFYLHPPPNTDVRTGSILNAKGVHKQFTVMSPDCDLVVRSDGVRNTDRLLLVEVVPPDGIFDWFGRQSPSSVGRDKQNSFERALQNNGRRYYHCLPQTEFSALGFLDFRSVSTVEMDKISERFDLPPAVQISPPFVKDIVARFSSYYARQGQPDIDFSDLLGS